MGAETKTHFVVDEEQRIWLIKKLLSERIEYRRYKVPEDEQEQKDLLRSLMNVRMPHSVLLYIDGSVHVPE